MDKIFAIWPSLAAMARDLGLPRKTVTSWAARGSIPAAYDTAVIAAAAAAGGVVTLESLAEMRAARAASVADARRSDRGIFVGVGVLRTCMGGRQ